MSTNNDAVIEAIRAQFGATAGAYASSAVHASGPDLDAMLAVAALTGHERVLDVGTGTGHTAFAFARKAAEVTAIDVTPEMIAAAREAAAEGGIANVRFDVGDAASLPYGDGAFDLVVCRHAAHHFPEPERALREVRRVLRPGGRFLLLDTVSPEEPALDTFLNTIEFLRDRSHVRNWRISEWLGMLERTGFDAHVAHTQPLPLDGADWVQRMRTPETRVALLRELFREANAAQREAFAIRDEPWGFTIGVALLVGTAR